MATASRVRSLPDLWPIRHQADRRAIQLDGDKTMRRRNETSMLLALLAMMPVLCDDPSPTETPTDRPSDEQQASPEIARGGHGGGHGGHGRHR